MLYECLVVAHIIQRDRKPLSTNTADGTIHRHNKHVWLDDSPALQVRMTDLAVGRLPSISDRLY
jgi:hypothetical protein